MSSTAIAKAEAPRKITRLLNLTVVWGYVAVMIAVPTLVLAFVFGVSLVMTGLTALGYFASPWSTVVAGVALLALVAYVGPAILTRLFK